jgi:hypothetical protein
VTRCIRDRYCSALRCTQQCEALKLNGVHDRLENCLKNRKRQLWHIPIAQADTPTIVANQLRAIGKRMQEFGCNRAQPIVFNMAEPVSCSDKRWAVARNRHGEIDAIDSPAKRHRLRPKKLGRLKDYVPANRVAPQQAPKYRIDLARYLPGSSHFTYPSDDVEIGSC